MKDRKYIIVEYMGHELPILFDSLIDHAAFLMCFDKSFIKAAGLFELYSDQDNHDYHYIEVYGNSTTLKIESRPEDKTIIEKLLNRN